MALAKNKGKLTNDEIAKIQTKSIHYNMQWTKQEKMTKIVSKKTETIDIDDTRFDKEKCYHISPIPTTNAYTDMAVSDFTSNTKNLWWRKS